jgi:hypothetical protein
MPGLDAVHVLRDSAWVELDPCTVDMVAQISHGRAAVGDGPTASTCTLALVTPTMPDLTPGDRIRVEGDTMVRFTGTITDLSLTHIDRRAGREALVNVTAVGAVATLGARDIGEQPWPEQTVAARAGTILTAAGVPHLVQGDPTIRVTRLDVDRRTALDLIGELASDAGAAVFDTPDGEVVFQHYAARAQTWQWFRWADEPPDATWDTQTVVWADMVVVSPAAPLPVPVDACWVVWEPTWETSSANIINHVTVEYGPKPEQGDRPALTVSNPGSIARYGRRHTFLGGGIADPDSALERAAAILDIHAHPRWNMASLDILLRETADPFPFLGLRCGDKLHLTGVPDPSPEPAPVLIVEGWTHLLDGDNDTLTLYVSDPLYSYAGITWSALPPALRWADVAPGVIWTEAITYNRLTGAVTSATYSTGEQENI